MDFSSSSLDIPPIDFEKELNPQQYAAVSAKPGPALVLAGAGSGKTRTLTYRVAYLLSKNVAPHEILLLTFTNKAAKEMLTRVEDLTGVPAQRFWGGTFHSIGQRFLRMNGTVVGLNSNYTILDQSDAETLLTNTINEIDKGFLKKKSNPKAKVIGNIISLARNMQEPLSQILQDRYYFFAGLTEEMNKFYESYQKRKIEQQVADYDDLLVYWLEILKAKPEVQENYSARFRYILVDEYQDTNRLQAEIIDRIGTHHNVMIVGDDAQCIYTWRGAHFENMMTFKDRHPGTVIHKIETNYRSTPEVLGLANCVLNAHPYGNCYHKELHAVRDSSSKPMVVSVLDTREQATFIVTRIAGLIEEGKSLSDIAILYRAHYQALDLQMELDRRMIPYIITSGIRFFEQAHIKDAISLLRFTANPDDISAFIRFACLLPKIGERTANKLHAKITELAKKNNTSLVQVMDDPSIKPPQEAREEWQAIADSLVEVEQAAREHGPQKAIKCVIEGWYGDYIRNVYPNWETRRDDLDSLLEFASRFEEMSDFLSQLVLLNSETSDKSIDPDQEALRLTTIHQAKGLEYPYVFIISLAEGLFPSKRAIEDDNIEEERRLFYVAVTRAKDELYLSFPKLSNAGMGGMMPVKPSRFLQEIPKQHYELLRWRPPRKW